MIPFLITILEPVIIPQMFLNAKITTQNLNQMASIIESLAYILYLLTNIILSLPGYDRTLCMNSSDFIPDLTNCSNYFSCDRIVQASCPEGLVFNDDGNFCDNPQNVERCLNTTSKYKKSESHFTLLT